MSCSNFAHSQFDSAKIQIGISACLLGKPVRFDGGHKRSAFADAQLRDYVEYISICPEMAIGMGTPRPTIRQVQKGDIIHIQGSTQPDLDVTQALNQFSQQQSRCLEGLSGYIVCAKSPTCGMERVKVYNEKGQTLRHDSVGVFTQALMDANPLLPIEESGRLCDPVLKENFITRVFAYHEWQTMVAEGLSAKGLLEFHARYKYLLLAHSPTAYSELGSSLANLSNVDLQSVGQAYISQFMDALKQRATRKSHTNVLLHLQGYFKRHISSSERQALAETIHQYRKGLLPLMAPMTLIKHLLVKLPNDYLNQQKYLTPHPEALALRSAL